MLPIHTFLLGAQTKPLRSVNKETLRELSENTFTMCECKWTRDATKYARGLLKWFMIGWKWMTLACLYQMMIVSKHSSFHFISICHWNKKVVPKTHGVWVEVDMGCSSRALTWKCHRAIDSLQFNQLSKVDYNLKSVLVWVIISQSHLFLLFPDISYLSVKGKTLFLKICSN